MMTKANIIDAVAKNADLTKKASEAAVNAAIDAIVEALKEGEKVQVFGLGTFAVKEREARSGRNPRTGETIEIAASKNVSFSAAKAVKDALNK